MLSILVVLTPLRRYIKASVQPFYHHLGTAAMTPRALGGVVDPANLKVYGTTNLRVVDASVIPIQFAAQPQATIYAIAERVSSSCLPSNRLAIELIIAGAGVGYHQGRSQVC